MATIDMFDTDDEYEPSMDEESNDEESLAESGYEGSVGDKIQQPKKKTSRKRKADDSCYESERRRSKRGIIDFYANLVKIILTSCGMIPTSHQVFELKDAKKIWMIPMMNNMTMTEWYYSEFICDGLFSQEQFIRKKESLRIRTENLVSFLFKKYGPDLCPIVMMDGHGRTLYMFIDSYKRKLENSGYSSVEVEKKINNLEITIVDIDEHSHEWHKEFFPVKVKSKKIDVFEFINTQPSDTFFYLNFCGAKNVQDQTIALIKRFETENRSIAVSFMIKMQEGKDRENKPRKLMDFSEKYGIDIDNKREDFKSYMFNVSDEKLRNVLVRH